MDMNRTLVTSVICAALVGLGLTFGGFLAGSGFYKSKLNDRYVTVKGVSERDVVSDLAIWNIRLVATGDELTAIQDKIENDKKILFAFFTANNIPNEEIESGQYNVTDLMADRYRSERAAQSRYIINYSVTVRSNDVNKIKEASAKTGDLLKQGLALVDNSGPSYVFTKLGELKPEMIAEATKGARTSAEQFANDSGSSVGPIRRASQGVFSIQAKNIAASSDQYSDPAYQSNDAQQIEKKVRVVSTIDYFLVR